MSVEAQAILCTLAVISIVLFLVITRWARQTASPECTDVRHNVALHLIDCSREFWLPPLPPERSIEEQTAYSVVVRWEGYDEIDGHRWSIRHRGVVFDQTGSPVDERDARLSVAALPESHPYSLPSPYLFEILVALNIAHTVVIPRVRQLWEDRQPSPCHSNPLHEQ
ncbi:MULTISPECIES: hypothetical protein [unclassified Crossiella]|uniref:hypothetical protein n=1 Tax=unclassified Crossiella TaxID=2620835 RepID=UPI002000126D|nr:MULTISPECIES: hypothetical protein [unclassified Crossiella]MCK2240916.1 hypothetical protein [Crossiella sp. S99.2]MCK2253940.1 hypothetical protein [Crossiella sp. S99.1]